MKTTGGFLKKGIGSKKIAVIAVIVLLCFAVIIEAGLCSFFAAKSKGDAGAAQANVIDVSLNLDTSAIASELSQTIGGAVNEITGRMTGTGMPVTATITGAVKKMIYSDAIVDAVMAIAYPLLFDTLTELKFMDFADKAHLYPTPAALATRLSGKSYTAVDKDGERKPLTDVLNAAGEDWKYFDTKVTFTNSAGKNVTTTIWNSCEWGITDSDSFYSAMQDMTDGIRGVVEVTMQAKRVDAAINPIEFILGQSPVDINIDAATVYSEAPASGYSLSLIPLFEMLGLKPGEFVPDEEFCSYENLGDCWKAIFEPVLLAVDKAVNNPVDVLPSMLLNFADATDSGTLVNNLRQLRLDGDFADIAGVLGFRDGPLFNLGDALIEVIKEMGIDLTGDFNRVLDSLLEMISKKPSADMPDMDTKKLYEGSTEITLSDGNKVLKADFDKTVDYLISYIVDDDIIAILLDLTPLKGTETADEIVSAFREGGEGIQKITSALADLAIDRLLPMLAN